jgi:hypothetical protein
VFVRLVIVMFVGTAATRGMTAVACLDVEVVVCSTQPQLHDLFSVQRVILWLRNRSTLFDEVMHGAVPNAAAKNNVHSMNTARQTTAAPALLADGFPGDNDSVRYFPDEQIRASTKRAERRSSR